MCLRECAASYLSLFPAVDPAFLCRTSCFDAPGINGRIAYLHFAPGFLPGYFNQMLQDLLPQSAQTGAPVEAVYGQIGWKIMRQMPPLTPCFHRVKRLICQFPLVCSHPEYSVILSLLTMHLSGHSVRLPCFISSFHVFVLLFGTAFMSTDSKPCFFMLSISSF